MPLPQRRPVALWATSFCYQVEISDPCSLLSSDEARSRVLCPVLDFPIKEKDMELLERIQHLFIGMMKELEHLFCKESPRELEFFSLEKKRYRGIHQCL